MFTGASERRPNLFGMVTTAASRHYTPLALRSFFTHTPLSEDDRFILIDNDADFELPADVPVDRITLLTRVKSSLKVRRLKKELDDLRGKDTEEEDDITEGDG